MSERGEVAAVLALQSGSPQALFKKLSPGPGMAAVEVADHQRARIQSATLEIIGEGGYEALTVREITRLAKVSSRAFYEHYADKTDCFLGVHKLIVHRVARSIVTAQAAEPDWREQLRATFAAFLGELERDPAAARLLLNEAYVAGSASFDQVRRAERTFETRIADCFASAPESIEVSPLVTKGIASAMICLSRSRLLDGQEDELSGLAPTLTEWALSFCSEVSVQEGELDRPSARRNQADKVPDASSSRHEEGARGQIGDRPLILAAVTKLALSECYEGLTVPAICLAAGVSRRRFHLQYGGVEECFVEAAELQVAEAFARAAVAGENAVWVRSIQSTMSTLCQEVASDGALRTLGFVELFNPGPRGLVACNRAVEGIYDLIVTAACRSNPPHDVSVEASAAAIWGLLRYVALDDAHCRPVEADAILSLLAVAPLMTAGSVAK